ncbi:hypothetical protein AM1_E0112 (plasmid) [Acaryochloris marina MBIC11017]|uniref:Uncharacterized protein n=1 Tax=Acaryochloris marina (strain MBIC 11017) TaxID=329726 RepID=A8ZPE5_ACAM1|nr:hypothetical protein AM1_E0112 [Acaryochloris marina MBIC11017]
MGFKVHGETRPKFLFNNGFGIQDPLRISMLNADLNLLIDR